MEDTNRSGSATPTFTTKTQVTQLKTPTTITTTITTPTTTTTNESDLTSTSRSTITAAEPTGYERRCPSSAASSSNSSLDVIDAPSTSISKIKNHPEAMKASKNENMRYGKCKWFNVAKGWGFITPNDGGQEVFVHQSVIQMSGFRSLGEQEEVEFEAKETERGLEAIRVSGSNGVDCHGSTFRPRGAHSRTTVKKKRRRIRCYNCGEFSNHIAAKCELGPQPKRCHFCKQTDHLYVDCTSKKVRNRKYIAEDEEISLNENSSEDGGNPQRCIMYSI